MNGVGQCQWVLDMEDWQIGCKHQQCPCLTMSATRPHHSTVHPDSPMSHNNTVLEGSAAVFAKGTPTKRSLIPQHTHTVPCSGTNTQTACLKACGKNSSHTHAGGPVSTSGLGGGGVHKGNARQRADPPGTNTRMCSSRAMRGRQKNSGWGLPGAGVCSRAIQQELWNWYAQGGQLGWPCEY